MKKNHERTIFDGVFGSIDNLRVIETEQPDFICESSKGALFGVEVTELFLSESDARLRRVPGYAHELLTHQRYRHKDDIKQLRVENVVYFSGQTREQRSIKAVVTESYSVNDVINRFVSIIESKNEKCEQYAREVSSIDLIVHDVNVIARFREVTDITNVLYGNASLSAIKESNFREIYLVTSSNEGTVNIPVRAQLFATEMYTFHRLWKSFHQEVNSDVTTLQYVASLITYLTCRLPGVKYDFGAAGQLRFVFGSVACFYGDSGLQIVDISVEPDGDRKPISSELDQECDTDLLRYVNERRNNEHWIVPLINPIGPSPLVQDNRATGLSRNVD